ncbi:MAG: 1-acyl-sn-glycerol-3-phosphate acyltransferase [Xanthomonadaceae bacterium]|jgi:1-acyl-sn-glycerol-3-phosphate acyltransferase|nr:1-acyl-sn-glycerol-3-phosphate acyltransferase [Xanthomonadaceae bacterium]
MRGLRLLSRLPLLALHFLLALPATLLLLALPRRGAPGGDGLAGWAVRAWAGGLLRIFGLRVRRLGTPLPGAVLFVANHVSWIDIPLIHSQVWASFVSKAEVARWPLVGWLAGIGGTLYHHRGSQHSLHGVMHQMLDRLRAGRPVAVFPEGRANSGEAVGVFHARIFQPALLAPAPVQPVALRYGHRGEAQTRIAFAPGERFVANFLRLLGEPGTVAEVHFLEPVYPGEDGRRRLAETCRERVAAVLAD